TRHRMPTEGCGRVHVCRGVLTRWRPILPRRRRVLTRRRISRLLRGRWIRISTLIATELRLGHGTQHARTGGLLEGWWFVGGGEPGLTLPLLLGDEFGSLAAFFGDAVAAVL